MIKIREAKKTESEIIISFQLAMAQETEGLVLNKKRLTDGVEAVFANPSKGQYFIAESDERIIASLLITYEWSDWRNLYVWWFQSVYVLPEYRRKGVFSQMYSFVRKKAEEKGAAGLRLYVESNNVTARKTYQALGMNGEHYSMYEWLRE